MIDETKSLRRREAIDFIKQVDTHDEIRSQVINQLVVWSPESIKLVAKRRKNFESILNTIEALSEESAMYLDPSEHPKIEQFLEDLVERELLSIRPVTQHVYDIQPAMVGVLEHLVDID